MNIGRASGWADAVFHVLAHVDAGGAASCFSPAYRAYARDVSPTLAEDVRVLEALAREDEGAFARAQAIAWMFRSVARAREAAELELRAAEVDDEAARAIALGAGAVAEVLRAAAELRLLASDDREEAAADANAEVRSRLRALLSAAPALEHMEVWLTPGLGLRGRVHGSLVIIGTPGIAGATAEHVAWQAAHEATVFEVAATDRALPSLDLERRALGLLRFRAVRAGLAEPHARWLAHLDLSAVGAIPDAGEPA